MGGNVTENLMMNRTVIAAVALILSGTLYLAAQQPAAPPAPGAPGVAPGGGRGGGRGGPPGGGPEVGMNTRPPNAPDQKPAVAGQTRAPERSSTSRSTSSR